MYICLSNFTSDYPTLLLIKNFYKDGSIYFEFCEGVNGIVDFCRPTLIYKTRGVQERTGHSFSSLPVLMYVRLFMIFLRNKLSV